MGEVVNVIVAFAVIIFVFKWATSGALCRLVSLRNDDILGPVGVQVKTLPETDSRLPLCWAFGQRMSQWSRYAVIHEISVNIF